MGLQEWQEKALFEVELPSGVKVLLRQPTVRDCLIAGGIPLAEVQQVEDGKEPSLEDMTKARVWDRAMVCLAVAAVDGEAVELTPEDVAKLPPADITEILAYAVRDKSPDPKED